MAIFHSYVSLPEGIEKLTPKGSPKAPRLPIPPRIAWRTRRSSEGLRRAVILAGARAGKGGCVMGTNDSVYEIHHKYFNEYE